MYLSESEVPQAMEYIKLKPLLDVIERSEEVGVSVPYLLVIDHLCIHKLIMLMDIFVKFLTCAFVFIFRKNLQKNL